MSESAGSEAKHGRAEAGVGVTTLRVRYADTDAMGVAYHSNYLIWFEQGRTELLRQVGCPYRELEAQGIMLPVSEVQVRYLAPAHYDDLLTVETRLVDLRSRQLTLDYEIRNEQGRLLATGRTIHIIVDHASGRPARLPAEIAARMRG